MDTNWYHESMDPKPIRRKQNAEVETTRETHTVDPEPVDKNTENVEVAGEPMSETVPDVQVQQPMPT